MFTVNVVRKDRGGCYACKIISNVVAVSISDDKVWIWFMDDGEQCVVYYLLDCYDFAIY